MQASLLARGLRVEIDRQYTEELRRFRLGDRTDTFYGGYRTVEEMEAFLDARWRPIRPSPRRSTSATPGARPTGRLHTARPLRRLRPVGAAHHQPRHPRPQARLLVRRGHPLPRDRHPRGGDALHRLPPRRLQHQRRRALAGGLARHLGNADAQPRRPPHRRGDGGGPALPCTARTPTTTTAAPDRLTCSQFGTDLNRNFPFKWGCCGGSSGAPAARPTAAQPQNSEEETQAIIAKVR